MIEQRCAVCLSSQTFLEAPHPETLLYRCRQCEHCFADAATIVEPETYDDEYYEVTHRNWFRNPDFPFYRRLLWFMRQEAAQARSLIDIGCGRGALIQFLHQSWPGLALTGLDLNRNQPYAGVDFIQGDFFEDGAVSNRYDIVVSIMAIEHVRDVRRYVERLIEVSNAGALIVITTINERSLLYEASRLARRFGLAGPYNRLYSKHHLNHFNLRSLERLARESGLIVRHRLLDNLQMKSVDIQASNPLAAAVMRFGVWMTFALGGLIGRTYRQTLFCVRA